MQNLLSWEVLLINRLWPVAITGDITHSFLQIYVTEKDCDVLRFHWIENKNPKEMVTLHFTRVIFGLRESPFSMGLTVTPRIVK